MIDISNCSKLIDKKEFFIIDDNENKHAYINNYAGQFKVINKTDNNINFLKIDNCIEFEQDSKKCDCAIFDDDVFCFIELKTMTSDKTSTKNKRRKNAENQLMYTIDNFKDENIVRNKNKEAYVSITCIRNDKLTQITNIENADKKLEFLEDFNTKLYYTCEKEFK